MDKENEGQQSTEMSKIMLHTTDGKDPIDSKLAIPFPAMEKAEEIIAKMEAKEKALIEREAALDAKLKAIDRAQAESRIMGHGQMRIDQSEDEKADESARKLLKGTGMEDLLFPRKRK
jgi:CRISPR/Cas system CSM-associated protein Csm3 (group 7 of RAMP superfamily)